MLALKFYSLSNATLLLLRMHENENKSWTHRNFRGKNAHSNSLLGLPQLRKLGRGTGHTPQPQASLSVLQRGGHATAAAACLPPSLSAQQKTEAQVWGSRNFTSGTTLCSQKHPCATFRNKKTETLLHGNDLSGCGTGEPTQKGDQRKKELPKGIG